jgi:D-arginine dehydrogenase
MAGAYDILIVGGGIAGISAAARLAPEARVAVLEREGAPGTHATGRSAATFIESYGPPAVRAASRASRGFFDAPPDGFGGGLLEPRGLLFLIEDDAGAREMEALRAENPGVDEISADEAVALVPDLRRERIRGAVYEEDATDIDVDRLLQGFLRALRAGGSELIVNAEAKLVSRRGGVWRVETPAGAFEAPVLVNAAGAWVDELAERAGAAPFGFTPKRRSAAIVPGPVGMDVTRWPLFAGATETWYAKPTGGKLMVSPADAEPMPPMDAWPDDMVLAEGLHRFEQAMTTPVTRVERSWAGLRTFSPDGTPVIGFDAGAEGFFWLAGQGGYGVQTSPGFSALAAALILGRDAGAMAGEVAALSPHRFNG